MKRIDAMRVISENAGNSLVVCNIGFPCRELCSVSDRPETFYMLGSMGMSSSIGLGVALAVPDRNVKAIDGDGSVLMNLGTLVTISSLDLDNFMLIILDNGAYGSTGFQPTSLCKCGDLYKIAEGAGVSNVYEADTEEELNDILNKNTNGVLIVKIEHGNSQAPLVPHDPQTIKKRFMEAVSQQAQL